MSTLPSQSFGSRGTVLDATRTRSEREVHLQGDLLDAVPVAVIATDLQGTVTHWNRGAEDTYGWTCEETIGRAITDLTIGPEDEATAREIMEAMRETGRWEGEYESRRSDRSRFPAHVRSALLTDDEGQVSGAVGVSVDISHRVETERQLRSTRDYLRAVNDSMGEGLFTLDIEGRLTYLNRAGEQLLGWRQDELIGQVMHDRTHYRRPDGKSVAVEDRPLNNLRRDGQVVRLENEIFIRKDGSELPVGITLAPFETEDGVRGSVVVFSDMTKRNADELRLRKQLEDLSWVGRIQDALAEDRFVLFAQAIVDMATGQTVQHELLIRMIDSGGSLIAPEVFLPAAEQYGLIVDIDRWVVRQAFELAGQGHPVALNLSAHSLASPGLLDEFRAELQRTSADPSLVVVELTETALVADEQAAALFIERVTALGCKLALDDFGTGYGGFSYLKRLPVDYLKVDIEFVRDLATNEASRHVLKAVVSLARGFGQKTVAEGVEDDETLRMLGDFDVDYAQGFAIARPLPVTETLCAA
jgi:PAS domain S-box-containing protein